MDHVNRFCSKTTFALIRLEYAAGLIVSLFLAIVHIHEIRWLAFIGMFAYIDLIGYLPGAVAYRCSNGGQIARGYYVLYNTMHSMALQAAAVVLWCAMVKPEWALLAIPIHLSGDRALFGNFLKPFAVPFEPKAIPEFQDFQRQLSQHRNARYAQPAVRSPV